MANRPGRQRLSIDIPEKLHANLLIICRDRNLPLTRYVIRALIRYSINETKYEDNGKLFDEFK